VIVFYIDPIEQPEAYHHFVDDRLLFGIPNALNVLSNMPFILVGLMGMNAVLNGDMKNVHDPEEVFIYKILFLSFPLVAAGSSFYHYNPNHFTLVWDRLPMTIAFAAIVASLVTEKLNLKIGYYITIPTILLGFYSVISWYNSELAGHGDMRLYIAFQLGSFLLIPIVLFTTPHKYTHTKFYLVSFALYGLAKIAELADSEIYSLTNNTISGHTIKHLISALAMYCSVHMVKNRKRISSKK